ncbi:MAG: FAD-binding oxidoreductase [Deltaproteobacteria bacterium]|nr:FAD-binding oxidoreductase [Deltaproteobacteria bacterium]
MAVVRLDLEELRRALAGAVGDLRVSTKGTDRTAHARDMWTRLLFSVRAGAPTSHPPDAVVWPETAGELAEIMHVARRLHVPVVPYGAGSGVCGGVVPLHGGISIDLKRMDRILRIDPDDLTCEVEAGVMGERLERELCRKGFTLGHFPSSIYCSTVGGWLAARSAGQLSTKYGKIEDMVRGLTAVTGRGDVITTGRHGRAMVGPDFTQLLVGSEGTLAIITSARLKIRPAPELLVLRGYEFPDVGSGLEGIRRVMQRGLRPAVVRLYDEFDTFMALLHKESRKEEAVQRVEGGALPSLEGPPAVTDADGPLARLRALIPSAAGNGHGALGRELFHAALVRSRVLNTAAVTLARKLGRRGCMLIVGTEGARARTEVEASLVGRELEKAGGKDLGEEPGKNWLERRYAMSYKMPKVYEMGAFADTMEVASTWERLLDLYDSVRQAISRHAFVMAHFSHAYPEGCSIYFTFVGYAATRQQAEKKYDELWRDGLAAATRAGGTISHHHGVGLLKSPFMADEHRDSMAIYQALKNALDPDGILNPGKMGLSWQGTPFAMITRK